MFGNIFDVVTTGAAAEILCVEAKHPTMHGTAPTTKSSLTQHVSSADVGRTCYRAR